jgi:hypothetical protein
MFKIKIYRSVNLIPLAYNCGYIYINTWDVWRVKLNFLRLLINNLQFREGTNDNCCKCYTRALGMSIFWIRNIQSGY